MSDTNSKELEKAVWRCGRCNKRLASATERCPCNDQVLNKTVSAQEKYKNMEELRK